MDIVIGHIVEIGHYNYRPNIVYVIAKQVNIFLENIV